MPSATRLAPTPPPFVVSPNSNNFVIGTNACNVDTVLLVERHLLKHRLLRNTIDADIEQHSVPTSVGATWQAGDEGGFRGNDRSFLLTMSLTITKPNGQHERLLVALGSACGTRFTHAGASRVFVQGPLPTAPIGHTAIICVVFIYGP